MTAAAVSQPIITMAEVDKALQGLMHFMAFIDLRASEDDLELMRNYLISAHARTKDNADERVLLTSAIKLIKAKQGE